MKIKKNEKIGIAIICICLIVFLIIPVKLPYSLQIQGKLLPGMEWFVLRDTDGSISVIERNHLSNAVTKNKTFVASRGDILQIELSKEYLQNTSVKKNDLIATIYSNETSRQLVEFRGKLNSTIAELKSVSTGEKKELIAEARQRLNKAEEELIQEQKEFERISGLYNGQLISLEQYELAQSRLRIKQIDRDLQTASLSGLTSGAKPEQIEAIRTEIQLIENGYANYLYADKLMMLKKKRCNSF